MNTLTERINEHRHPAWMLRHPRTVRLIWVWFWVLYQRSWVSRRVFWQHLRALPPGSTVTDAGCGEGLFLLPAVRRFPRLQFLGLDVRRSNLELCRRFAASYGRHNLRTHQTDLNADPLPARTDLILCVGVLHCLEHDAATLQRFARALSPGGRLLLYSPVHRRRVLPGFEYLFQRFSNYEQHFAERIYSTQELHHKLAAAGFLVERQHFTNGTLGILGYELTTGAFLLFSGGKNWAIRTLGVVLFAGCLPVQIVLNVVDYLLPKRSGNGVLLEARRRLSTQNP